MSLFPLGACLRCVHTWPWAFTGSTKGFSLPVSAILPSSHTDFIHTHSHKCSLCMVRARDWMQWAGDACWMLMRFFLEKRKAVESFLCASKTEDGKERVAFINVKPCSHLLVSLYWCVCLCTATYRHTQAGNAFSHSRVTLMFWGFFSHHLILCLYASEKWSIQNTPALSPLRCPMPSCCGCIHKLALSSRWPSFYVCPG